MPKVVDTTKTKRVAKTKRVTKTTCRFTIHVVSEATGSLAKHIASVLLSQFPKLEHDTKHHPFCATATAAKKIRRDVIASDSPIVLHALTQPAIKRSFMKWCEENEIPHYDLIGSAVDFVSLVTKQQPVRDATRAHRCNEQYFKRIEAWEFTLQHDDSRRLETVQEADIVLLGVSRAGKTPLAAYLGSQGYRVANIAIAPEAKVPKQIAGCRNRTVGLTLRPERLAQIRERRFELNGIKQALEGLPHNDPGYYSRRTAIRDIMFAEKEFRKLRIRSLDMTDLTVEESAARVLVLLGLNPEKS